MDFEARSCGNKGLNNVGENHEWIRTADFRRKTVPLLFSKQPIFTFTKTFMISVVANC